MTVPHISPQQAQLLLAKGAVMIDIREPDEHAREHIPEARLVPLSRLAREPLRLEQASAVIFHCRSGNRTRSHAARLAAGATCDVYLLEGGLEAWKGAGLAVSLDERQPLELMRQVQIAAGLLILLGVGLGAMVHASLYALAGLIGAGLTFAGISGHCGLARLLQAMPWNRRPDASS